ncbi:MAG: hypothetical protein EOO74_10130, partial [Myxococcales bacterium]
MLPLTPIGEDPNRGFMSEGVAEECAPYGVAGSRCDVTIGRCTKPLFDRKIKTIAWYYGPDAPADLFASTANATNQWNLAVKSAAVNGMKAEWDRLHGDVGDTDGEEPFAWNEFTTEAALSADAADRKTQVVPDVFVLCHNPVMEGDHAACGRVGLRVRMGDLRYNSVNLIDTPQMGSPWGIMVDGVDPLTGEKVASSINEWITVLDGAAQGAMDTIRWLNGEISDEDVVSGKYLNEWLTATNKGLSMVAPATPSEQQIKEYMGAAASNTGLPGGPQAPVGSIKSHTQMTGYLQQRAKYVATQTGPSIDSTFEANRKRLIDSKFEVMLANKDQLQRVNLPPDTPVAEGSSTLASASILRGLNPEMRRWKSKLKGQAEARNHYCMVEQEDSEGFVSLARTA